MAKKSSRKKESRKESSLSKMELESLIRSMQAEPEPEPSVATPSKLDAQILAYMLREQASQRDREGLMVPGLLDQEMNRPTLSGAGPLMVDTFKEGGEVDVAEQMTVGTLPEDAREGSAEAAFRALVEGSQGFLGLEPGRKGTEAYRTGQALSNLPMLAVPAAAVKAAPKVKGAVEDVATRAMQRITENPDLSARDIYNAMLGKQGPGASITPYRSSGDLFEQVEKLPTNQFIDEVMGAHIGGVGDFGDESAKYYLSQIPGGPEYIKASQELARKNLGNQFMAYRLMPKDQFEALQSGDVGDLLSFSLSQNSAEALRNFVKNQKRDDLVVAEVPLTPEHVIAFGSPSEQEVIIDTGVGWSLDQFKQAAPLKKAEGGEVTNDEFIQEMMTGTRPTDQEADPDVLKDIVRGVQYTPFDVLGAPVDIATMVMRPFGYDVEKPVGGSEYFIDQAAKLGLFKPSTGSAAELLGRIGGGGATPAIARGITKAADATGDFISGQLKGRADRQAVQQAASKVPPDTAYDPLRDRMEQIGALTYAVKPKGGNVLLQDIERAVEKMRPMMAVPGEGVLPPSRIFASQYAARLKDQIERNKQAGNPTAYMEGQLSAVEPKAALDNWIQTKLSKYIRTDMASEADPVRKLAEEMSTKVKSDYEAGLKRIAKMKNDITEAKAKGKNTDASETTLAAEIDKVENAFRQTSLLPVSIGPYTHPAMQTAKNREMAGFSPYPISKTSLGKEWEEIADREFYVHKAGDLVKADSPAFRENPWIANLDPEAIVYTAPHVDEMHMITHTLDELENALNPTSGLPPKLQLKPEDMQQLSIEKAFRTVNDINDWRLKQRVALNLEEAKRAAVTVKEYTNTPGGLKWQELKAPTYTELPPGYVIEKLDYATSALKGPDGKALTYFGATDGPVSNHQKEALSFLSKNDLERALKYEGSTMRHCVGGYCDDVWSGQTRIYSLRDAQGEPHVTIETAPVKRRESDLNDSIETFLMENPKNIAERLGFGIDDFAYARRTASTFNPEARTKLDRFMAAVQNNPEFNQWSQSRPVEEKILQIKGKVNQKPTEKYIPFVQDFVASQPWSSVGDMANTDLVPLKSMLFQNAQNLGFSPKVVMTLGDQPYTTKEEFNRIASLFGGIEKYATGGEVSTKDFIRAHA